MVGSEAALLMLATVSANILRTLNILTILFILIGCSWSEKTTNTQNVSPGVKTDTNFQKANFKDREGLRQGRWTSKNKQNEIEIKTYKNDTLDGYCSIGNYSWRHEGFYRNGKLDGIQRTYAGMNVVTIGFYKDGKKIWFTTFDESLIPIKGFSIQEDTTIFVEAHFPSGQKWYEGEFISKKDKGKTYPFFETIPIGQHKIYFTNGKLKGIVNYSKKTIAEYDSFGKQIYNTIFSDVETHGHPVPTDYYQ